MIEAAQITGDKTALQTRKRGPAQPEPPPRNQDYAELKRLIMEKGLLNKQPRYYVTQILLILALLALSITVLVLIDSLWIQLANAVFLAFVFTQISFLGHDAAHRQIFRRARYNNIAGTIFWNVILGMSNGWFIYRHNRHHVSPNEFGDDPDTDLIILSLSEEQTRRRSGLLRSLVKYQVFLLPLLSLEMIALRYASFRYLRWKHTPYPLIELPLTAVSVLVYLALPYYFLGLGQALLFIALHQLAFGLYFSSVIAANHKGMPLVEESRDTDLLRQQVLTARNVRSHPLTDFWYGGLNFQIEHHLFPSMPRNQLREAQPIVKRFCQERGIAYRETGLIESYRDIIDALREVSILAGKRTPA